jgi:hypothetical protein
MAQKIPAAAKTVRTMEARAMALLLRGNICIDIDCEFFGVAKLPCAAHGRPHSYDTRHILM